MTFSINEPVFSGELFIAASQLHAAQKNPDSFLNSMTGGAFESNVDMGSMNAPSWQDTLQMSLLGAQQSTDDWNTNMFNGSFLPASGMMEPQEMKQSPSVGSVASFSDQSNVDHASPHPWDVKPHDAEHQQTQHVASMPVPGRSQSESLWQRRLQTRNKEINALHNRMSAPDVPTVSSDFQQQQHTQDPMSGYQYDGHTSMSHSFDSSAHGQDYASNSNAMFNMMPNFNNGSFSQQEHNAHVQAAINNALGSYAMPDLNNQQDVNYSMGHSADSIVSPRQAPYGKKTSKNGAKARRVRAPVSQSDKANDSDDQSGSSKGVINKVIVPSAPGSVSDAVDVRTGETGQMRHICPFAGCDKHFSTSGHARRHSRIHDCLRPFECPHDQCHATFTRRDNCTQHQRARHRFQLIAHRLGDDDEEQDS